MLAVGKFGLRGELRNGHAGDREEAIFLNNRTRSDENALRATIPFAGYANSLAWGDMASPRMPAR